jgi:uncharacterized protein
LPKFLSVGTQKKYIIQHKGLSQGSHRFDYHVGKDFFEGFGCNDFHDADLKIVATLSKKARMMELNFDIDGLLNVDCDRCLGRFDLPVTFSEILYVTCGEQENAEDVNMIFIRESDTQMDLSQYIYEIVLTHLPYRKVHPDGPRGKITCNEEMLSKIVNNSTNEKPADDLRWEDLKKIRNKLNKNK